MSVAFSVIIGLTCSMIASVSASAEPPNTDDTARQVIRQYLRMPHPSEDRLGTVRGERLAKLDELKTLGPAVVAAIEDGLTKAKRPAQRSELAEVLRHFPSVQSGNVLDQLLSDRDLSVRRTAIHIVRLLSCHVNRFGPHRIQRGEPFAPQVEGLLPLLLSGVRRF